jgi:hypothetical protein
VHEAEKEDAVKEREKKKEKKKKEKKIANLQGKITVERKSKIKIA